MTDDFINQSQLAGAAAVACSDLLGLSFFSKFTMKCLDYANDFLCFGPLLLLWIAVLVRSIMAIVIDFNHVAHAIQHHHFVTQRGGIRKGEQSKHVESGPKLLPSTLRCNIMN